MSAAKDKGRSECLRKVNNKIQKDKKPRFEVLNFVLSDYALRISNFEFLQMPERNDICHPILPAPLCEGGGEIRCRLHAGIQRE